MISAFGTVKLGEIVTNLPTDYGEDAGTGEIDAPVVKVSNVAADGRMKTPLELRGFKRSELDRLKTVPGELLVVKSSGSKANVLSGKTAFVTHEHAGCVASNFMMRLRPISTKVDSKYLWHFLNSSHSKAFVNTVVGTTTYPNLKWSTYQDQPIPLPPLSHQHRIAAILDKADSLRAARREAVSKLDQLLQSVFLTMFGDPTSNPNGWPTRRIDEVTDCLDRLRRPVTAKDREPGHVPYYGANGQQGWINASLFNEPLVLVAEDGGHFEDPGRGVAYRIDGPSWVNNHAHILRAKKGVLETEYLHRALKHYDFVPFISGTTRAKLTQGQLNGVPLAVPPLELQNSFALRVELLRNVASAYAVASTQLDHLCQSLYERAFSEAL